jgi:UDP-2,3-diacylglucosamine pyrophosphatase LpxH
MSERLTDEQCRTAVRLKQEYGSERKAAASANMPRSTFRNALHRAAERGLLGFDPVLPGYAIKSTATQFDKGGDVKSKWVQQHKESGKTFEMPAGQKLAGVSALVDGEGRVRAQWVKTKGDGIVPDLVEALEGVFAKYKGRSRLVPTPRRIDRDLMTVYPIADQHLGLLSWGRETGAAYDLKIGIKRLLDCASKLMAKSERSKYALIMNLGDWYHANDQRNVTPRSGHQLDVDGRWYKVLTAGVELMMQIIDLALAKHELVEVVNIPGNHDPEAARAMTVALRMFYANNKRVKISFPGDLYFRRFGTTLIGAAHGDKMRPDRMAMTMATQRREDWGKTAYHWFLSGHIHHETLKEVGDVRCESFQTLADKDNYANAGGYNSGQSLNAITLHRLTGEDGRHRVNIPPPSMRKGAAASRRRPAASARKSKPAARRRRAA